MFELSRRVCGRSMVLFLLIIWKYLLMKASEPGELPLWEILTVLTDSIKFGNI